MICFCYGPQHLAKLMSRPNRKFSFQMDVGAKEQGEKFYICESSSLSNIAHILKVTDFIRTKLLLLHQGTHDTVYARAHSDVLG